MSRLLAVALLLTAWMIACATPIVGFLRGGVYTQADAAATARYFALFALSLALWSAQGIYARAFYAARNTLTPALSGTVVTLVSIPIYALLFHRLGLPGLALASDAGILLHTAALAILLHRARLVSLASLDYSELARASLAAVTGYLGTSLTLYLLPHRPGRFAEVLTLTAATTAWAACILLSLSLTKSRLLSQLRDRKAA